MDEDLKAVENLGVGGADSTGGDFTGCDEKNDPVEILISDGVIDNLISETYKQAAALSAKTSETASLQIEHAWACGIMVTRDFTK